MNKLRKMLNLDAMGESEEAPKSGDEVVSALPGNEIVEKLPGGSQLNGLIGNLLDPVLEIKSQIDELNPLSQLDPLNMLLSKKNPTKKLGL